MRFAIRGARVALARSFEFLPRALDETGGLVRRPYVRNTLGALTSEKYIRELIQYLRANGCA